MILESVKKKGNFMELVIDEKTILVTLDSWAKNFLYKGMEISEERLQNILLDSKYELSLESARKYSKGKKSEKEMSMYLEDLGLNTDRILHALKEEGFIDDLRLCENYVLLHKSQKSRKAMEMDLNQKGFAKEMVSEALKQVSDLDEEKVLDKLVKSELRMVSTTSLKNAISKTVAHCINRGFTYENTKKRVEENIEIMDNIDESQSLKKDYQRLLRRFSRKYDGDSLDTKIFQGLRALGYLEEQIKEIRGGINESKES